MAYAPVSKELLAVETPGGDVEGTIFQIQANNFDSVGNAGQEFWAHFDFTQVGTGQADARIQTSWNKTDWVPVAIATQLSAAGERKEVVKLSMCGRYIRAGLLVGGSAQVSGTVRIATTESTRFNVAA